MTDDPTPPITTYTISTFVRNGDGTFEAASHREALMGFVAAKKAEGKLDRDVQMAGVTDGKTLVMFGQEIDGFPFLIEGSSAILIDELTLMVAEATR